MATAILRDTYGFLRWRLIPVRMLGKLRSALARATVPPRPANTFDPAKLRAIETKGYCEAGAIDDAMLAEIRDLCLPRAANVEPRATGHPFENIVREEDFTADNPVFRLAMSEQVLGAADAYFGGQFLFDSIQVLHSFPTEGPLRESQKWHKDYGDSKSLHFIMYVNDVTREEDGPFGFVGRETSKSVTRLPIIRRLEDDEIRREIGDQPFETFYGKAGEAILVDPSVCYHYGSRCKNPRTAIFVTFNTAAPYEPMCEPLRGARKQAAMEARKARPDLPGNYLDAIFEA